MLVDIFCLFPHIILNDKNKLEERERKTNCILEKKKEKYFTENDAY